MQQHVKMPRHYDLSFRLRGDSFENSRQRLAIRKRDGLVTEANKTKHWEVEESLDAQFGKSVHFKYHPNSGPMKIVFWTIVFLFLSWTPLQADNAKLNSAIATLSAQTTALQNSVTTLSKNQIALIQKYHLTNAGQCALLVVGVSTGTAGNTIPVTLSFLPSASTTTAVQVDLFVSSSFTMTGTAIGPAGMASGKSVQTSSVNGGTRVLVFGLNTTPIGPGILATLTYSSVAGMPKDFYPITPANITASDPNGLSSLICATSGAIKLP